MKTIFFLVVFIFVIIGTVFCDQDEDMKTIFERIKAYYISTGSTSVDFNTKMQADGSWSDVEYYDMQGLITWTPYVHLNRLFSMSRAYNTPTHDNYQDPALIAKIRLGLNYWFTNTPDSATTWHTNYGQQRSIGPMMIILKGDISTSLFNSGIGFLSEPSETGSTNIYLCSQSIIKGIATQDIDFIELGMNGITRIVYLSDSTKETSGFFSDYSYQSGMDLQNSGNGNGVMYDSVFYMYFTQELSFYFSSELKNLMANYILDGTRWMIWKKTSDYSTLGNYKSRHYAGGAPSTETFTRMAEITSYEVSEAFSTLAEHISQDRLTGETSSVLGNKHFWLADYQAHRRKNYFASVRMTSTRTLAFNSYGENYKGYYNNYGATYFLINAYEYRNTFANLDWTKLSGVTCQSQLPTEPKSSYRGKTDYVGGCSDGYYGFSAMKLDYNDVTGQKAYFFFDDQIVAIGTNIKSTSGNTITTSVNQCKYEAECTTKDKNSAGEGSVISFGTHSKSSIENVVHSNIGYFFPDSGNVKIQIESRSNNWNEICPTTSTIQENDIITIWFDHGVKPQNADYYYHVVMNTNKTQMVEYKDPIELIENSEDIQAVRHKNLGIYSFIFYTCKESTVNNVTTCTAESTSSDGLKVSVNSPCMVMINLKEDKPMITVSDPLHSEVTVDVKVNLPDGRDSAMSFQFFEGDEGGKSIATELIISIDTTWVVPFTITFVFISIFVFAVVVGLIVALVFIGTCGKVGKNSGEYKEWKSNSKKTNKSKELERV